jgi:hypothetical protein
MNAAYCFLIRNFAALALAFLWAMPAGAANQTPDVTPIQLNSALPYQISVVPYDFGSEPIPTLHSYNAAHYDGKWVLFAGRTNGLHGFETPGGNNFLPEHQNRHVWVIDPVNKVSWSRELLPDASSGLTETEIRSLTPANTQFYQQGDRLYVTGGYGHQLDLMTGPFNNTFNTLSAIELPGLVDWVVNGTGTAKDHIRQITGPAGNTDVFTVTGGAMYEIDGRTHLIFGQRFTGNYTPGSNGTYTQQVRSFDIVDDGMSLSVADIVRTPGNPGDPNYRRRDLNVYPVLRPGSGGGLDEGIVVLSGVFTLTDGAWTVPVEVFPDPMDANMVNVTMDDPNAVNTFKQGFNGYHSAKFGLYSESREEMHELLFGGISLQYLDTNTQTVVTDDFLPFINDITSVVIDGDGNYSQHWIGEFPELFHVDDMMVSRRLRFGANAEFFLAEGIETYENGVIKLDALTQPTLLGYIYGGIQSNSPHTFDFTTFTRVPGAVTSASNHIFAVYYTPVPEPSAAILAAACLTLALATARRRRALVSP